MLYAVIMAGGMGKRFWPESRASRPKQLLSLGRRRPMVEETLDRIAPLIPPERILVLTNAEYLEVVRQLLSEVPEENIIGEPASRDTAACIGLAAALLVKRDAGAVMAVMPSDHLIDPQELFCQSLEAASECVSRHPEMLVTFGIEPTMPATGYGYIQRGDEVFQSPGVTFFRARKFHEKPRLDVAEGFLEEGGYLWNAGIFVWRAAAILEQIERFLPKLHVKLGMLAEKAGDVGFDEYLAEIYPTLPKISIDFGVMEKAEHCAVAAVSYRWDDLGSWRALGRHLEADGEGNRVRGGFVGHEASDLIVSARGGIVAAIGVKDLIIVHTPDATLVCRKEDAEKVKAIVERLDDEYL